MLKERILVENSVVAFEGSGCVYRQGDLIDCECYSNSLIEQLAAREYREFGTIAKIVKTGPTRVRLTITRPGGGETLQWRMVYSYL